MVKRTSSKPQTKKVVKKVTKTIKKVETQPQQPAAAAQSPVKKGGIKRTKTIADAVQDAQQHVHKAAGKRKLARSARPAKNAGKKVQKPKKGPAAKKPQAKAQKKAPKQK